jgi:polysaccharide export outer membrane protein
MTGKFAFLSFAGAKYLGSCAGIVVTAAALIITAKAQPTVGAIPSSSPAATSVTEDTRYRIGPGDVLSIFVRKSAELSVEAVRVDQRGMIHIPMIDHDVPAACKTESELAADIKTLYLEYKTNPGVEVFIKSYNSQPVAVVGAVDKPGQFQLFRRVRLLELISLAGGQTDKAGRVINVIHAGGPNICAKDAAGNIAKAEAQSLSVFKLNDTLNGLEEANPFIRPGDVISLPEADRVYVVGYVFAPISIALKDKPITVSRAIAMAGGPQRDASTSKVRIIRQTGNGESKQEIAVDLKAILKLKAEDVTLVPNDIVEVGASTSKQLINMLTGTLPAVLSQGVVRAVP